MIVAFSTSSSVASVAVFNEDGDLIFSEAADSNMKASEVCLAMLERSNINLNQVQLFLADIGPGSFTGTRVGVTLAKTLAYTVGAHCGGAFAFDLISVDSTVVFPSKKGEWFVRHPGQEPYRSSELPTEPYVGFGPGIDSPTYPEAKRFQPLLSLLPRLSPVEFVPSYLIEPSISVQKKSLGLAGGQP